MWHIMPSNIGEFILLNTIHQALNVLGMFSIEILFDKSYKTRFFLNWKVIDQIKQAVLRLFFEINSYKV